MDLLCDYPDQWALLDQLELVPHAVGEAMRYRPIGFALPRIATEHLELAGVRIPAETIVLANTAAANRDPAAFSDPDRFDITRDNTVGTLSFGNGAHYCLGSHLARLELAQAPDRDGPAHAQPPPCRTSPVAVDDRSHRTHHPAPRIRPRTLNPLSSHQLSRLPIHAPIIDSRKAWTNSWGPAHTGRCPADNGRYISPDDPYRARCSTRPAPPPGDPNIHFITDDCE